MSKKLRLVILGMMGRCPFGGQTWLYLNWLSGLKKLGHDVWYVEDDSVWLYNPATWSVTDDCSYAIKHISNSLDRIGLEDKWAFRLIDKMNVPLSCQGLSNSELNDLYRDCDVLLNIVGATQLREEHLQAPLRVYIETDPVSAQLRLAQGNAQIRDIFSGHHKFATYGENYGSPDCSVPLGEIEYIKTRQPIDLDFWSMAYTPEAQFFTTIGNYKQVGSDLEYGGEIYRWSKHYEWEKFIDLPKRISQKFELALKIDGLEDIYSLENFGWRVVSPYRMSLDVFGAYPEYIRQSRAEFTVAKDQNIRLRSGWFSERDACYLASGKPVVAQDTGFSNIIPTGEGLFAFSTMDEVLAAIDAINSDYQRHCKTAKAIAEEYFEASSVAAQLLKNLGFD